MTKEIIQKYCEVLLEVGVNLYHGQCLLITTNVWNYSFAEEIAKVAYQKGAKYVKIDIRSNNMLRTRIDFSEDEFLTFVPDYVVAKYNQFIAEDWCYLSLDNLEELDTLAGADVDKLSDLTKRTRQKQKNFYDHLMNDGAAWCIAAYPGAEWANKVIGKPDIDELWKTLIPILKLDADNPVSAWAEHGRKISKRAQILNDFKPIKLHFKSPETDLTVYLNETSSWLGAQSKTPSGRSFLPNIPTEEIFTTPNYLKTEGYVKVTKPLEVLETLVEDAKFVFKDGKVVDFDASKGKNVLAKYLQMDEGASFLGEVALVDSSSAIYQSGKIFHSILFDENASCHIALGSGYVSSFTNANHLFSDELKRNAGCNVSLVHTDFMIGSDDLSVSAYNTNGDKIVVLNKGLFSI